MEQLLRNIDIGPAMRERECSVQTEANIQQIQERMQGMNAHQQRQYLERHHRDLLEKIGDWARPWTNNETDAQAVTRLLNDLRAEQNKSCNGR